MNDTNETSEKTAEELELAEIEYQNYLKENSMNEMDKAILENEDNNSGAEENALVVQENHDIPDEDFEKILADIVAEEKVKQIAATVKEKASAKQKVAKEPKILKLKSGRGRGRPERVKLQTFLDAWNSGKDIIDVCNKLAMLPTKANKLYVSMRASTLRKHGTILAPFKRGRKPLIPTLEVVEQEIAPALPMVAE